MNADGAGPSGVQTSPKGFFDCFRRSSDLKDDQLKVTLVDPKEKENKLMSDVHFLRMNSHFITSFQAGYQLPWNGLRENAGKKFVRCNFLRRKKSRSHPYKDSVHFGPDLFNKKDLVAAPVDESPYRLRTTSLSSGSAYKHKRSIHKRQPGGNEGLTRSRSMEDLSAISQSDSSLRTKDLDTVSQGIQQLHMEDTP